MTVLDAWAAAFAAIAGSNVLIRAHMLRPHHRKWVKATPLVVVALTIVALALWMCAITIFFGNHANSREGLIYGVEALGSLAMLWNLGRNGQQADARQREITDEVNLVMGLSGDPAKYRGERS